MDLEDFPKRKWMYAEILLFLAIAVSFTSNSHYGYLTLSGLMPLVFITMAIILLLPNYNRLKVSVWYVLIMFILIISTVINAIGSNNPFDGILNLIGTMATLFLLIANKQRSRIVIDKLIISFAMLVIATAILDLSSIISISPKSYLLTNSDYTIEGYSYGYSWIYFNPNSFSMLLFFLISYLLIYNKNNALKLIVLSLLSFLIVLTASRAGVLSSVIVLIGYLYMRFGKIKTMVYLVFILPVLVFAVYGLLLFNNFNSESLFGFYETKINSGADSRTMLWQYVIDNYIMDSASHLLFGNGMSFGTLANFGGISVHNSYLNSIAKYGLCYLIVFILFLISETQQLLRMPVFICLFIAIFFYSFVESVFFTGTNGLWVACLIIASFGHSAEYASSTKAKTTAAGSSINLNRFADMGDEGDNLGLGRTIC